MGNRIEVYNCSEEYNRGSRIYLQISTTLETTLTAVFTRPAARISCPKIPAAQLIRNEDDAKTAAGFWTALEEIYPLSPTLFESCTLVSANRQV